MGRPTRRCSAWRWRNLDWLVVRDFTLIESATWWKDGPEIQSGELKTEEIATEVFFFPAASHTEKNGAFTNTNRMLQWHYAAKEPDGDARSELWFMYHLGRLIREKHAGSADEIDRVALELTWDYPTEGSIDEPNAEAVLAEINGWDADGSPLASYKPRSSPNHTCCTANLAERADALVTIGCGDALPLHRRRALHRLERVPDAKGRLPQTSEPSATEVARFIDELTKV